MPKETPNYKVPVPSSEDIVDIEKVSDALIELDRLIYNIENRGGAYAGRESMADDLPPLSVLFVVDDEGDTPPESDEFEAVVYDNMVFDKSEPKQGENWGQLEETAADGAANTNSTPINTSGLVFKHGRLTVSESEPDDSPFWNKI